ncbi:MAG: hypothetical protein E6J57_02625, partial [Deltaproteobacteria bacterium]
MASTFAAPASPAAARPAHDPPTPHARFRLRPETRVSGRSTPTRDKVSGRFVRAGRLSSPAMILARPPAATPLAGADSLPAALEDVTQAGGVAREYLGRVRASLRARHEAGAGGLELVAVYADAVDHLVRFLFASASAHFMSRFARLNQQCTVVAQGGYGRGELNPGSDIDLLFLYPWKVNPYVETVAEVILYALWDAGLQVGNALRNIRECERLSGRDL